MLHVVTLLWDANEHSLPFSRGYDEEWVNRLYRGFARNLTLPFRFVVFTDRDRSFAHPEIGQERLTAPKPDYGSCVEPFRLNQPMILVGLDTVVVGNCDAIGRCALMAPMIVLPRDPYNPKQACNGVVIAPDGKAGIWERWKGQNDMEWLRQQPHAIMDDILPGQVISYKGHVKKHGLGNAKIVFFHGFPKMDEARREHVGAWIGEHWR